MLKEVAEVIASQLEEDDLLVRYGGDEYVVILPAQDRRIALEKMVKIHRELSHASFLRSEGLEIRITASSGIAGYPQDAKDKKDLLQLADKALYRSKEQGKNSITVV